MRSIWKKRFSRWSFALTALTLMALPAAAQDSRGGFTMTKEVHWSTVTLAPGEYLYSLEHRTPGVVICVRPKAGGAGYFLMASSISTLTSNEAGQLTIERRGDGWYVTSMTVGETGEKLIFLAPHGDARATVADNRKVATIASR